MFGIDKIWDVLGRQGSSIETIGKAIKEIQIKLLGLKDHIKSVQSINDKRYNKLSKKTTEIDNILAEHLNNQPELVKCDKCKCLLYKKDAIRGESRIVKKVNWGTVEMDANGYLNLVKEEIEQVYYCHKCKGKDEKETSKKPTDKSKRKVNRASQKDSKK